MIFATGIYLTLLIVPTLQNDNYAAPGEFPFVVSIRVNSVHVCTGCILDYRWVLTAAHCFLQSAQGSNVQMHVVAGTTALDGLGGSVYGVMKLYIHQNYSSVFQGQPNSDLALIKLINPLQYSAYIKPIKISYLNTDHAKAITVGWSSNLKSVAMTTVRRDAACLEDDTHLCAVAPMGYGTCFGDTGGPIIDEHSRKLIGISCVSPRTCATGVAEAFTKVYPYLEWINYIKYAL